MLLLSELLADNSIKNVLYDIFNILFILKIIYCSNCKNKYNKMKNNIKLK